MIKSDSIKSLAIALSKFQSEIENPKNTADNPFYKSKYAPLPDILTLVRPLLSKYGLSVIQSSHSSDGCSISITTLLMHESGEWIETEPLVLKAEKATPQGSGSAITYGRRYQLSGILGISSEDDDDANAYEKPDNKSPKSPNQPKKAGDSKGGNVITEAQRNRLFALGKGNNDLIKTVVTSYGYSSSKEIKKLDYEKICKDIETKLSA